MARGGGFRERKDSKRQARFGQLVRSELSDILLKGHQIKSDVPLPEALRRKISILDIQMSPDVRSANVFVTVQGETAEKRQAFAWIKKNSRPIRHALAQRLKDMRGVPELYFRFSDVTSAVDLMYLIDNVASTGTYTTQEEEWEEELSLSGNIGGLDFDDDLDEEDVEDKIQTKKDD